MRNVDHSKISLTFSRNPLAGEPIASCTDIPVLAWKLSKRAIDTHRSAACQEAELEHIEERLKAIAVYDEVASKWVSAEQYAERRSAVNFSRKPMMGESIADCEDAGLLCWKLNKQAVDTTREEHIIAAELEAIMFRANELGCKNLFGRWMTPEEMEKDEVKEKLVTAAKIEAGEPFDIYFEYGLQEQGVKFIAGKEFHFPFAYQCGTYFAPGYTKIVDAAGRGHRTKGKTVRVEEYELVDIPATIDENGVEKPAMNFYNVCKWSFVK